MKLNKFKFYVYCIILTVCFGCQIEADNERIREKRVSKTNEDIFYYELDDKLLELKRIKEQSNKTRVAIIHKIDTVVIDTIELGVFLDVKIDKLNDDELSDIILTSGENRPFSYVYLSDKKNGYSCPKGKHQFNDIKALSKPGFYSMYKNTGCASLNWESELLIFRRNEVISLATIKSLQCGDSVLLESKKDENKFMKINGTVSINDIDSLWLDYIQSEDIKI